MTHKGSHVVKSQLNQQFWIKTKQLNVPKIFGQEISIGILNMIL